MPVPDTLQQEILLLHAQICQGLADPKRILLLYALAEGPRRVTDLAEALGFPQPTVSHHLRILRERGLVTAEQEGTAVYYALADERVIRALDLLREVLRDQLVQQADLAEQLGAVGR
ncbi:MAG: metalloregulator ArsR/SmtB family transcription factor [Anaerolineae bacterium]|nr:metalloregulator ArsR/SmtB family transcription factor [Anaerolineae bacterium]MCX8067032.1 metalloregulator ArsR/SmtB family transcription factor [Anaerolineae bacterium]MDW7990614.1 metalloregulator ArsR/SmtB family transcription factor [Anaerolineae bacterium]